MASLDNTDGIENAVASDTVTDSRQGNMAWGSAISVGFDTMIQGIEDAAKNCKAQLEKSGSVDLAVFFISSRYCESRGGTKAVTPEELASVVPTIQRILGVKHVIGCVAAGVVGAGEGGSPEEYENFKAVSLTAACLPGVTVAPFRVVGDQLPSPDAGPEEWRRRLGPAAGAAAAADQPVFVMMGDTGLARGDRLGRLLEGLDFAYPGCIKVGGMASPSIAAAMSESDPGPLVFTSLPDDTRPAGPAAVFTARRGAPPAGTLVGVCLSGNIAVEAIVAQGCRAIGPVYEVSQIRDRLITQLQEVGKSAKSTPVQALASIIQSCSPEDVQLAQNALLVGVSSDDVTAAPTDSAFLIRQVLGVGVKEGSLAVAENIKAGQRIQFFVRDRQAAVDDVEGLMATYKRKRLMDMMSGTSRTPPAAGLLMFACFGRGRGLFGQPNFDSRLAYLTTGVPVGGGFCNGEIGPVGGRTFLHGFTSVFAVFRRKVLPPPPGPAAAGPAPPASIE